MSTRLKLSVALALALCFLVAGWILFPWVLRGISMEECNLRGELDMKVDCWDSMLRHELQNDGIQAALSLMRRTFETYPDFAVGNGGCHERGHVLGAAMYLEFYLGGEKLSDLAKLVPDIDICSWGVFHGFTSQLFSNHPDPVYVRKACDLIASSLVPPLDKDALEGNCFHGAGNGFMSEQLKKNAVPNDTAKFDSFFDEPYRQCSAIPGISEKRVQDCVNGAFAAFFYVYLPTIDNRDPEITFRNMLALCSGLRPELQPECYFPIGFRIASIANGDPAVLAERLTKAIPDKTERERAFEGAIVTIVQQQVIDDPNAPEKLFAKCKKLNSDFWEPCASGISRGVGFNTLADHTGPDPRSYAFCSLPDVVDAGLSEACLTFGYKQQ